MKVLSSQRLTLGLIRLAGDEDEDLNAEVDAGGEVEPLVLLEQSRGWCSSWSLVSSILSLVPKSMSSCMIEFGGQVTEVRSA